MRRGIVLGIVAVGLAYLYVAALVFGVGVNAAQRVPAWWLEAFPTRPSAVHFWIVISHVLVVLLVSLPFAWIIARAYGRRFSLLLAVAIALMIWGLFEAPQMFDAFGSGGAYPRGIWWSDTAEFIGSLPLLVLLLRRRPRDT